MWNFYTNCEFYCPLLACYWSTSAEFSVDVDAIKIMNHLFFISEQNNSDLVYILGSQVGALKVRFNSCTTEQTYTNKFVVFTVLLSNDLTYSYLLFSVNTLQLQFMKEWQIISNTL